MYRNRVSQAHYYCLKYILGLGKRENFARERKNTLSKIKPKMVQRQSSDNHVTT